MMGEVGGNDYNYAFFGGKSIEEVKNLVPEVVQAIMDATRVSVTPKQVFVLTDLV